MTRSGFTIVELLIVISIIGLLLGAASVSFSGAERNARDSQRLRDLSVIAKAIDQAASTSHGIYPKNVIGGSNSTMCASAIVVVTGVNGSFEDTNGGNLNKLDASFFPNHRFPQDPLPVNAGVTNCQNMLDGYTYHTEYGHLGLATPNLAAAQQVTYSLEVGLEGDKPADETTFINENDLPASVSRVGSAARNRYILNGPRCGSNCYNQ